MNNELVWRLAPQVSPERAQRRFQGPGWYAWVRHLANWRRRTTPRGKLELVWLPGYRVECALASGKRSSQVSLYVDGLTGEVSAWPLLASETENAGDSPSGEEGATWSTTGSDDCWPVSEISRIECLDLARAAVRRTTTLRPARAGPSIEVARAPRAVAYPVWVYYFARRGDKLDCVLLDAITGRLVGAKGKQAFLSAMVARHRRKALVSTVS